MIWTMGTFLDLLGQLFDFRDDFFDLWDHLGIVRTTPKSRGVVFFDGRVFNVPASLILFFLFIFLGCIGN